MATKKKKATVGKKAPKPEKESKLDTHLRRMRTDDRVFESIKTTDDAIPHLRRSFVKSLFSIEDLLNDHASGKIKLPVHNLVGIFAQLGEKLLKFEGKDGGDLNLNLNVNENIVFKQYLRFKEKAKKELANDSRNRIKDAL